MNSNQSTPAPAVATLQQEIKTRTEVIRTLADLREQLDADRICGAWLSAENNLYGYVDASGQWAIRPQFAYAVRHGANPDALRMVDRIAAEGVRDPAVARERLLALGFSEKDTTVARQVGMFSQVDPREMRDIVPYIVSIHGKFYEMTEIPGRTEEYEDVAIDYKNPIYWLKQGGYEGYINSEYEGQRHQQDQGIEKMANEVEEVRRHHEMLARYITE